MEHEIVKADNAGVMAKVDLEVITEYLDSTGLTKKLLPKEKTMFVNIAQMYGLNPFKREIYCTVYGEGQYRTCSIVTGYEVYLKRAERIGVLNGWKAEVTGSVREGTLEAKVTIYRKDWAYPFEHTVSYNEVCQTKKDGTVNKFWAKMPSFMTKKVAIAQAFRLCFPDEFGGMPYTSDEVGVDDIPMERNITPQEQETQSKLQDDKPCDYVVYLENLLAQYPKELAKAKDLITGAISGNNTEEIKAMYTRTMEYLKKRGIKVA